MSIANELHLECMKRGIIVQTQMEQVRPGYYRHHFTLRRGGDVFAGTLDSTTGAKHAGHFLESVLIDAEFALNSSYDRYCRVLQLKNAFAQYLAERQQAVLLRHFLGSDYTELLAIANHLQRLAA